MSEVAIKKERIGAGVASRRFALALAAFALLVVALPFSEPLFAAVFPWLDRPLYRQESFGALVLAHLSLAAAAIAAAGLVGIGLGVAASRPGGAAFRRLVETLTAMGQTVPPVAVLALTVPVIGFGFLPAFVALFLYSLLPITENTLAGLEGVPPDIRQAASGIGFSPAQSLIRIELPLAAPVILAGLRLATVIAISTAAIASTAGSVSLGSPIIVGLNGNNIAYILQGALLTAMLAITVDVGFEALAARLESGRGDAT